MAQWLRALVSLMENAHGMQLIPSVCNSSSWRSNDLSSKGTVRIHMVHRHTRKQNTCIHKIVKKKNL
jgi:hypothetical protein